MGRVCFWIAVSLFAAGCGAAVSDPCTTEADCGGQICLNRGDWTPGGYCSKPCTVGDDSSCPGGTTCVRDIIARDQPGCLKSCISANDCRKGYNCRVSNDSPRAVCVGNDGP